MTATAVNVVHAPPAYPVLDGVWGEIAYQASTGPHKLALSQAALDAFCAKLYGKKLVFVVPFARKDKFKVKLPDGVKWPKSLSIYVLFLGK